MSEVEVGKSDAIAGINWGIVGDYAGGKLRKGDLRSEIRSKPMSITPYGAESRE